MASVLFFCDITSQVDFNSGIQRYTKNLAKSLIDAGVELIPVKMSKGGFEVLDEKAIVQMSTFNGPQKDLWSIDSDMLDASFLIYPELPHLNDKDYMGQILLEAKTLGLVVVSIFHDASPVLLGKYYNETESSAYMRYMQGISGSDIVVSVSGSSKLDYDATIQNSDNSSMQSIALLSPHCIDSELATKPTVKKSTSINMLFVSSFHKRKNHINLLKAFEVAKGTAASAGYTLNLTLVGGYISRLDDKFADELLSLANAVDAKVIINASDEELSEIYEDTDISIYPSFFEGYGFPIAESLSHGIPVLCSNNSSMIEFANLGGCVTFDPENILNMADVIINVALNEEKRQKLIDEIKQITKYDWSDYANDFIMAIGLDKQFQL